MFYHPNDSTSTVIVKHLVFWLSLAFMFGIFIFMFRDDVRIMQQDITIELDLTDKINICLPGEDLDPEKSFLNFD